MNEKYPIPIEKAKLPAAYESARAALAKCERVDECQKWADKAKALASYAKQAADESLHNYAQRIKDRAVRRGGELLEKVEPAGGARTDKPSTGSGTRFTRQNAAAAAGISKRQKDTMLRVAAIPAAEFERQVESERPPTVTALARQGVRKQAVQKPRRASHVFIEESDEAMSSEQARWERSAGSMLGEMLSLRPYWRKEFGDWEKFDVPDTLTRLAKQAAVEMNQLAKQLSKRK